MRHTNRNILPGRIPRKGFKVLYHVRLIEKTTFTGKRRKVGLKIIRRIADSIRFMLCSAG